MKREKQYYVPGLDEINQLVETPASKEKTEKERFVLTIAISAVAAFAAIVAAVVSILTLASI